LKTPFNLSAWAVAHLAFVGFLMAGILVTGLIAYQRLGRLEDPAFDVPAMSAEVIWPGATARQLQDEVLNRMERRLQEIDGIDHVSSVARPGRGSLMFWMKGGTSKERLEQAWYLARKKIGDVRLEFPEGVVGPFFNDEFTDVYSVLYALSAPGLGWGELQALAEDVKRQLQPVPSVNKVDILGRQAERVYVEFSSQRLAAFGVTPAGLVETLSRRNRLVDSGAVEGLGDRVPVRVGGALRNAADVAAVSVKAGDRLLRLSDVASVRTGTEDPPSFTVRHNGQPVLAIGVTMARHGNVIAFGAALDARLRDIRAGLPAGVTLAQYADQPRVAAASVAEFESAFAEALGIVLAVTFVFLGWRLGLVVAASVPLVLAAVATVMLAAGWSLDRISLGALIIALGLLVDDAIITVEMMAVKMEEGCSRVAAATHAFTRTAWPMLTGTLVTVAGFMPVGFAASIAGEYAGGIFWVVGVALAASWVVAVVFTPCLGLLLLPEALPASPVSPRTTAPDDDTPARRRLRGLVQRCVDHRWAALAATVLALAAAAAAGMAWVPQQFFPTAERLELLVELRMRQGASFAATEAAVVRLETVLKADARVRGFTAYTGAGAPRFYLSLTPELPDPGFAQFVVQTASLGEREALRESLLRVFDDSLPGARFTDLRGRVTRLDFGPPVGFPVQFRVSGPDPVRVRAIAGQVREVVGRSPLVRDTQFDWNEQMRSVEVRVDPDKASLLGLSSADVAGSLGTALSGTPATRIRRGEELIDVVVRADPAERRALDRLGDLNIATGPGGSVPLGQIARIEPVFEEPALWRRNRDTTLTVRSDLADGVQGPQATGRLWPLLQPVVEALPFGYRIERGGAIEESDKARGALFAVFPAMFGVMLVLLMAQLQSVARVVLVLLTAPLGLIGVVPALLVSGAPFGFVALLGVIALGGMVMRNAVLLVEQIDHDIAAGTPPGRALVDATVHRARPVMLTAAAAFLAMIPLTRSVFWGPMAVSIMGGLVVATVLTLGAVPALYAVFFERRSTRPGRGTGD
jgi:multidrug efflux pump